MKKSYETPELVVHGDVERITQSGGGDCADAAIGVGDPINDTNSGTCS